MKKKLEKATEEEGLTHIHNNYSIFKLSGRVAATFFITVPDHDGGRRK
jgi:hypothetical protein